MKSIILIVQFFIFLSISHAFIDIESNKDYLFHYRSETSGIKNWFTLNQSIDTEVNVQKISDNQLLVQLKKTKIFDDIDKPTSDELSEVTNPFVVVKNNGNFSFNKFLTKDREFVYCLKLKYRIIDMLLSDMTRFTKHTKTSTTKLLVENLPFGHCNSKVKVVKTKEETKVGVKAEYQDCHDDGRVNLATIFDLSPNSTTAAIVTIKKNVVKKINVLSDMMTYNMGGIHLKIRSSMTFKGMSDIQEPNENLVDFKVTYTKEELDRFIQNVD